MNNAEKSVTLIERTLPGQHGIEQDTQAPHVTGRVITLLLQHLHNRAVREILGSTPSLC